MGVLADLGQVEAVAAHALAEFGRLDVWVNNAGVSAPFGPTPWCRRTASGRWSRPISWVPTTARGSPCARVRYFTRTLAQECRGTGVEVIAFKEKMALSCTF